RVIGVGLRHPAANGAAAEPFVLEKSKTIQVVIRLNVPARIELERLRAFQPEWGSGLRIEVPRDHFARPGVESGARGFRVDLRLYSRSHGMIVSLAVFLALSASASDWNRFRGPNGSGINETSGLPSEFGPEKNLVWRTALPPGHSSPILVGDRIFLTAFDG